MRSRIAALAFTASLLAAAPLQAQTSFTFVNGGSVSAFGYSVGNYNGTMGPGNTPVILNCVDFYHHVSGGETWLANISDIASGAGIGTNTRDRAANALTIYKEAAYLAMQYSKAGVNNADIGNIQATMWDLFSAPAGYTGAAVPVPNLSGGSQTAGYWLTDMQAHYASANYSGWEVVTATNAYVGGVDNLSSAQEFLINTGTHTTSTPEPASLMLLGTGLLGLAGATRIRRKKQ